MTYCAVGGDHDASGSTVSGVNVPIGPALPNGYFLTQFCEEHQEEAKNWPPGDYYGKVHVVVTRD